MTKEYNLIVAGSRSWTNKALMVEKIREFYKQYTVGKPELCIISGTARGADQLGAEIAKDNALHLIECPATWQRKDGTTNKAAGYQRNERMAKIADGAIVFWDGQSKGSVHMVNLAIGEGLDTWLVLKDGNIHLSTPVKS